MAASLSGVFNLQEFTDLGALGAGMRLYTYAPATTTLKVAYTDQAGTIPHTYTNDGIGGQYIALNARGELPAPLFLASGGYDLTLKTSAGVTVWTRRAIGSLDNADALRDDLANSTDAAKGGGLVGFNPTLNYFAGTIGRHLADMPLNPKDFPWLAKFDGTTDDAAALNACAAAARAGGKCISIPRSGTAFVTSSLDFSGLLVIGFGRNQIHIQASSAQFDVITTTGNTTLHGLNVNGGWDGSTAGQSGDILSIKATSPAYPYNVHLRDCVFQYAKKRHIYWERGGYSSAWNVKCNAAGLHSLEMFGNAGGADSCTTIMVSGFSVFSDCPNGYGIKITECISCALDNVITENTKGVQIVGFTNRALSFKGVYAENTAGGKMIDWAGSSGIGIEVRGCFGGNTTIDYNANWQEQYFGGNSNLQEPAIPDANRIISVDGGEQTTAVAGSYTIATLSVPPGTWMIEGYVQTLNSASGAVTQLGAVISTNSAASGLNNSTGSLNWSSDEMTYNPGANADLRVQPRDLIRNQTGSNVNYYLRAYIGRSAGTVAFRGALRAVAIK